MQSGLVVKDTGLVEKEVSLQRAKKMVMDALEICRNNCRKCPGNIIKKIGTEYQQRENTCAVGYFVSEEVGSYINRHDPKNSELVKANTRVNIVALNYPQEMISALEELKGQLESIQ